MKYTISPSSFEPIVYETTDTQYPNGCLRYQSVRHLIKASAWPKTQIHPIYSAIGTIAEEYVKSEFDQSDGVIQRELVVSQDLGDDVSIYGRADYVLDNKVIEVKASVSASKRSQWRKGIMVPSHLGQLKSYMALTGVTYGVLRAFYMHFTREGMTLSLEPFIHQVAELTEEDLLDLSTYYLTVKEAIIGSDLPPKPLTPKPCVSCPFRAVCEKDLKYKSDFVEGVNTVLAGKPPAVLELVPSIKRHNRR